MPLTRSGANNRGDKLGGSKIHIEDNFYVVRVTEVGTGCRSTCNPMQEAVAPQLLPHKTFPCDKHASHASNKLRERLQNLSHLLSEGRSGTQSSSVLPLRRLIDFGSVEAEGGGSPGEEQTAVHARIVHQVLLLFFIILLLYMNC